jgi:adenylate cyclase
MQVKLTDGEQARLWARGTDNLEAYLKFLEGREHWNRFNKEDNALARRLAEEAIALDPEYGSAYRLLGGTHFRDVFLQTTKSPKQSIARAIELAQKAISLNKSDAHSHAMLAFLFTMVRQHDKAIAEGKRAVALDPNSGAALLYLGFTLRWGGKPGEAIPVIRKAIRLNPIAPTIYLINLGMAYLFTGHYEEAIRECKKATDREPNNLGAHLALAGAYGLAGHEEALAEAAEVLRIDPNFSLELFSRRLTYKNKADKEFFIGALRKAGLK